MMNALNAQVNAAPEVSVSAKTAKTAKAGKDTDASSQGGFSDALKGAGGEHGKGRQSAREASAEKADATIETEISEGTADVDLDVDVADSETAETVSDAANGGLRSFASLKAGFQAAIEAARGMDVSTSQEETSEETTTDGEATPARKTASSSTADKLSTKAAKAAVELAALETGTETVADDHVVDQVKRKAAEASTRTDTKKADAEQAEPSSDPETDAAVASDDTTLSDVLGLLSAGASLNDDAEPRVKETGRDRTVVTAEGTGKTGTANMTDGAADADAASVETQADPLATGGEDSRLFRLTRGEGRGQSIDLKIGSDTGGRIDVEARTPASGQAETVNVVEARRYLGFDAPSNSSALTTAFATNDEWVSAMHPSAKLANEAQLSSTGQVVNTLKLELNPHSLGTVTAMLRLSGDELSVHLTVHTSAAYRELKEDSSAMMDALRSQGFSVDQVTVSMASSSSSTAQDGSDQSSRFAQQQQQQNMQQAGGDGGSGRGNGRQGSGTDNSMAGGLTDESEQSLSVARGTGDARPDHVYI